MKVLIIRFSSFGDVLQTLSVAGRLRESWPQAEIHWVTRSEFVPLIETHPGVRRTWSLEKGGGLLSLLRLGLKLRREGFTHVYDAHNNLRSHVLGWMLLGARILRRPIYRFKRFMLFRFRRNFFPKPFNGQRALLSPLAAWGLPVEAPAVPQLFLKPEVRTQLRPKLPGSFVALAPSAAFALKRWPLEYWRELIARCPELKFVVLGGREDQFLFDLEQVDPERVTCLAGKLTLAESAVVVEVAQALVANDTGLMHVAEQVGKPCIALMGPAPFGFPSRPRTRILELELPCRPCSKHGQGPCVNKEFHQCLRGISVQRVVTELKGLIA